MQQIGRQRANPFDFFFRFYWAEQVAAEQAAAIAFRLLINLFPLFSVVGTLVSLLLRNPDYAQRVSQILYQTFPEAWESQITALAAVEQNAGAFGIIGFAVLCWFSTTLVESLGYAFMRQYHVPPRRPLWLRGIGLLLIIALAFVLSMTVFLTSAAAWVENTVRTQIQPDDLFWSQIVRLGTTAAGFLLVFLLLSIIYLLLPNIRLHPRQVWPGAFLSTSLFILALQLFPLYLRYRPISFSGGTFGFIFLLTTWFYLVAHIILLGNALNAYRWLMRHR